MDVKLIGDACSLCVLFGAVIEVLPTVAVLVTILWYGIRVWESEVMQTHLPQKLRLKRYKST